MLDNVNDNVNNKVNITFKMPFQPQRCQEDCETLYNQRHLVVTIGLNKTFTLL